jgi:hypothetical protein
MSIVAEIIGSVLGRQVAMAIFRQTENGMADVASVIGTPLLRTQQSGLKNPVRGYVILILRPEPAHGQRTRSLWLRRNSKEPLSTPRLDYRSVADDLRDVAVPDREVAGQQPTGGLVDAMSL